MWFEKYEKLNPNMFTVENSGNYLHLPPPYSVITDKGFNTVRIEGKYGADEVWKVIGYSESMPFPAKGYNAVAIMFENQDDFEKIWWHYDRK